LRSYTGRGATISAFIGCYSLTSLLAGYISGSLYAKSKGVQWIRTMVRAALCAFTAYGLVLRA
jgi:hypothetical protein